MATISNQERLVLQAIVEEHGDYGKPVADLAICQRVAMKSETVRDVLRILQEKELISVGFTERGLVSFVEARGRLKLGELHAAT
jgi:transcription initiation factor IIE alpha subunit